MWNPPQWVLVPKYSILKLQDFFKRPKKNAFLYLFVQALFSDLLLWPPQVLQYLELQGFISTSFESPDKGTNVVCLVKSRAALLRYVFLILNFPHFQSTYVLSSGVYILFVMALSAFHIHPSCSIALMGHLKLLMWCSAK